MKKQQKKYYKQYEFFMRTKTLLLKKHPGGQSTFITRRCKWCGKIFFKKHNRETYCSSKCKKYAHQEQKAIFANKYRRQYHKKECLGTSGLSKHRRQDYNQEYQAIQNEKKRLKIS